MVTQTTYSLSFITYGKKHTKNIKTDHLYIFS